MRVVVIVAASMLLAGPFVSAAAESGKGVGAHALEVDPIGVTPDQPLVPPTSRKVVVTVRAIDVPPARRHKASLIVYKPDGTIVELRRKSLRRSSTTFAVKLGSVVPIGTYTVHGTVEAGSEAFGISTTFDVATD